ncbi:MAG TPA: ABATE domain-containing protein [Thermoleophilaceae bacterium]|nr:ABATE domain-containing protein [Thermoleophilaceae bacterium]
MIRLTWEWIGQGPALDLADTVTVSDGEDLDLLAQPGEYERWAEAEAKALELSAAERRILLDERLLFLGARDSVRAVIGAHADGLPPPAAAVDELNALSRAAPGWFEVEHGSRRLVERSTAEPTAVLLARYARDALRWISPDGGPLRRCPAPSCGMFYVPSRPQQRWCSAACGSRARVARHYRAQRPDARARQEAGRASASA